MIPGLSGIIGNPFSLYLSASDDNIDVFALLGSPVQAVDVYVFVAAGVIIGSTSTASAAMLIAGFDSASTFEIVNEGRIAGAGGKGGDGGSGAAAGSASFLAAGGGGGAGSTPGAGGTGTAPATNGTAGTATAGGTHGTSSVGSPPSVASESGFDGGDAISHGSFDLSITNGSGEIWGGGGGGMGGFDLSPAENGGDGGDPGDDAPFVIGLGSGDGGNSLRGTGSLTWVSGSGSPNVEGDIGA